MPPKSPSRTPIFWGWYVVLGGFLVLAVNYGARYCFGVFIKPMAADNGWSRSVLSLGASLNMLCYSIGSALVGRIVDRAAPRWIITVGAVIAGVSYALVSTVSSPLSFYILYGVFCGVSTACMGAVAVNSSVAKWFLRRRGTAVGVSTMGIGIGTVVLSPVAGYVVSDVGWQAGFLFLGAAVFLVGLVVAQLLMHWTTPEAHGLLPDGDAEPLSGSARTDTEVRSLAMRDILSDRRFQILCAAYAIGVMALMAMIVHAVPFAMDLGIGPMAAASALSIVGLAGFLGQFFFGWFSDRVSDPKTAGALGLAFIGLGVALMLPVQSVQGLYLASAVFGFGYGSLSTMMPLIVADRFGRHVLGKVYGLLTFFYGIGGSLGPVLAGLLYDRSGGYDIVWQAQAVLMAGAVLLLSTLKRNA